MHRKETTMPATHRPRVFLAKYPGTCPDCLAPIHTGDYLVRRDGVRSTHELCQIQSKRSGICFCGASLAPAGYCDDVAAFGSHRDGAA
jgi:hypothetical protein